MKQSKRLHLQWDGGIRMKTGVRGFMRFVGSLLVLLLCGFSVLGQGNRASITGTVTDSSGGVILVLDGCMRKL